MTVYVKVLGTLHLKRMNFTINKLYLKKKVMTAHNCHSG